MQISDKNGTDYIFRKVEKGDDDLLAAYFLSLSKETRSRYGPHPLTAEYAQKLCALPQDTADRFIFLTDDQAEIIGYFIVEYGDAPDEKHRYRTQGIELEPSLDPIFAPSMADAYQDKGLASLMMPLIIEAVKEKGARSLVLMGGTQATNHRAIAFYEKFGFTRHGDFKTRKISFSWQEGLKLTLNNHDMRLLFEA